MLWLKIDKILTDRSLLRETRALIIFVIKCCILWLIIVVPLVISSYDQLVVFIAKYLSPDGHLSSPKFIIFLLIFKPIFILCLWLSTYMNWIFSLKFLKIYLMLYTVHICFYCFYTHFIIVDMPMEDSLLEWGTAILAFIASVLFFCSGTIGSPFAFLLCIAWLIFALEEISWGQRIFDFESAQFFMTYNLQQETNLHNLFLNPLWRWFYNGFNLFLFLFFTWFRKIPLFRGLYKIQGIINILRLSDKYGLWVIPIFTLCVFQYMGEEFVEEKWAFFGALLSFLLLIDLLSVKKNSKY